MDMLANDNVEQPKPKVKKVFLKMGQTVKLCEELKAMKQEIETGGLTKKDVIGELRQRTGIANLTISHLYNAGKEMGVKFKSRKVNEGSRPHGGSLYQELKARIEELETRIDDMSKIVQILEVMGTEGRNVAYSTENILKAHLGDGHAHGGRKWYIKNGVAVQK